jgi:uncharacterized C2H2 Zn-finger protein
MLDETGVGRWMLHAQSCEQTLTWHFLQKGHMTWRKAEADVRDATASFQPSRCQEGALFRADRCFFEHVSVSHTHTHTDPLDAKGPGDAFFASLFVVAPPSRLDVDTPLAAGQSPSMSLAAVPAQLAVRTMLHVLAQGYLGTAAITPFGTCPSFGF